MRGGGGGNRFIQKLEPSERQGQAEQTEANRMLSHVETRKI